MPKLRKMLGKADSPYIITLMQLIETQSKETISRWCLNYAEEFILPIFTKYCPDDNRPRIALTMSRDCLEGKKKLSEVKQIILNDCRTVAKALDSLPQAQAAARACGQASACLYTPTHSLGLAFYGSAAISNDRIGLAESSEAYEKIAEEECAKMEQALREISIINEANPAKINWNC